MPRKYDFLGGKVKATVSADRGGRRDIPKKCTVWLEGLIYEVNQGVGSKDIQICEDVNNQAPFEIILCMVCRY